MKKVLSVLLVICMLLTLVACTGEQPNAGTTLPCSQSTNPTGTDPLPTDSAPTDPAPTDPTPTDPAPTDPAPTDPAPTDPAPTDPKPTNPKPTDPKPTDPKPTDPKPTDPEPVDAIYIEAEKPVSKVVDTQNRTDLGGNPMDHTYRKGLLAADGLHYASNEKTAITFSAFDSYTYKFEAAEAGKYVLYILASCDRDSPIQYTLNSQSGTGYFVRNNYQRYDLVKLATVDVRVGTNTLTVTITENKNHNIWVDRYVLIPADAADSGTQYDWSDIIDAAQKAETITEQKANPVWKELYVSPTGRDTNDGSKTAPFATLAAANEAVKQLRDQMQGDIVIHVAGGTYFLSQPLVIGVDGGGANGYRVIYRGDSSDKPVISGGVQVTGWTQDGNIWSAPCDVEDTRTLYVNDNVAIRARSKWLYTGAENYIISGSGNRSDGMVVKHRNFPVMTNLDDVELVFDSEWMHHRYPVSNIIYGSGQVTIEMQQPYWHELFFINGAVGNLPNVGKGFYVENALELLDEPGEFYFDKNAKRIYYYPFPEENMKTAQCYVGVTEGLLCVRGDDKDHRVEGLSFENIQFKYGAWTTVSATGLLTNQADNIRDTTSPTSFIRLPGQIHAECVSDLTFRGCVFSCLGSSAIVMSNAVSDVLIDGNIFADISGIAISVGSSLHGNNIQADQARPIRVDITNNVIRRIGTEFRSSPAINAYYVSYVRIMHNDIAEIGYTGICLGWGWGQDANCSNNVIAYNKIVDVMLSTHDGSHIYTLSPNYNTYINNNWCVGSGDMRGGIYPDEGSGNLNIFRNVVEDVYSNWLFARPGVNLRKIHVFLNYSDTAEAVADPNGVITDGNVVVTDGNWPDAAEVVKAGAGVGETYKGLLEGVENPQWRTNFVETVPNKY